MTGCLLGAVLAGGASRRLGRDKATESVAGITMVERAVEALSAATVEVVVVTSRDLPRGDWRVVGDLRPSMGPLTGIEAALVEARDTGCVGVFVLACDLPLVTAGPVRTLVAAWRASPALSVAAAREGDPPFEPLCAIYPTGCLTRTTALLDGGVRAARRLFEATGGVTVPMDGGRMLNVNTERDLERAREALEREGAPRKRGD